MTEAKRSIETVCTGNSEIDGLALCLKAISTINTVEGQARVLTWLNNLMGSSINDDLNKTVIEQGKYRKNYVEELCSAVL